MKIICYDIGSYSLKRVDYFIEKKFTQEVYYQEFVLEQTMVPESDIPEIPSGNLESESETQDHQAVQPAPLENSSDWIQQVVDILVAEQQGWQKEDKVYLVLPEDYSTSRYINLPVSSAKKASQILPFQLEDSIPFSMDKVIYKEQFNTTKSSTDALVNIVDKEDFEHLYYELEKNKIFFDQITTNFGIISSLSGQNEALGMHFGVENFAILDIGHLGSSCFSLTKVD